MSQGGLAQGLSASFHTLPESPSGKPPEAPAQRESVESGGAEYEATGTAPWDMIHELVSELLVIHFRV